MSQIEFIAETAAWFVTGILVSGLPWFVVHLIRRWKTRNLPGKAVR